MFSKSLDITLLENICFRAGKIFYAYLRPILCLKPQNWDFSPDNHIISHNFYMKMYFMMLDYIHIGQKLKKSISY